MKVNRTSAAMLDLLSEYATMAEFYDAAYPETLVEVAGPVALGTTLITARQGAGDYSDAPVPDLVITRCASGRVPATFDLGAGRFRETMPLNAMVIVPPGTPTTILIDRPNVVEFFAIPYAPLARLCSENGLPPDGDFGPVHRSAVNCPRFTGTFLGLAREVRAGNPSGPLAVEAALMRMVAMMMEAAERRLPIPAGGLAPWQLARVTDHLHAHLAEPVTLAELAALTGLSVFHFARAFKASTGLAPHQFHISLKLEQARLMLAKTDRPVTEIALALGYDSSQSFARSFRAAHGTSPSRFRGGARR